MSEASSSVTSSWMGIDEESMSTGDELSPQKDSLKQRILELPNDLRSHRDVSIHARDFFSRAADAGGTLVALKLKKKKKVSLHERVSKKCSTREHENSAEEKRPFRKRPRPRPRDVATFCVAGRRARRR